MIAIDVWFGGTSHGLMATSLACAAIAAAFYHNA
jgi:hypothetical protein